MGPLLRPAGLAGLAYAFVRPGV